MVSSSQDDSGTRTGSGTGRVSRSLQPALVDWATGIRASGAGATTPCLVAGGLSLVATICPLPKKSGAVHHQGPGTPLRSNWDDATPNCFLQATSFVVCCQHLSGRTRHPPGSIASAQRKPKTRISRQRQYASPLIGFQRPTSRHFNTRVRVLCRNRCASRLMSSM